MGKEEGEEGVGNNKEETSSHEKGRQMGGAQAEEESPHPGLTPSPTGVEKVSQPHDIAVVQLTHNLQLGSWGAKGRPQ